MSPKYAGVKLRFCTVHHDGYICSIYLTYGKIQANIPRIACRFCNLNLQTKIRSETDLLNHTHFFDQDLDPSVYQRSFAVACKIHTR